MMRVPDTEVAEWNGETKVLIWGRDKKLLEILRRQSSPLTRTDICKETKVKWTTAYDSLVRLHTKGFIGKTSVRLSATKPSIGWYAIEFE